MFASVGPGEEHGVRRIFDGEIAGVWRAKMAGRKRLDLTVTPFGTLSSPARKAVEQESAVVARARGATDASVMFA